MGIDFLDALAIRENVVRVEFDEAVSLTGLLEASDASKTEKWIVQADPATTGMDGEPARAVSVVRVELATEADGVAEGDVGRFVNLVLDRPMTSFPAAYDLSFFEIYSADLGSMLSGTARVFATHAYLEPPKVDAGKVSRDFANPQGAKAAAVLGTFVIADDGDYATDQGPESLKKRVLRRLMTRKGAFAHLPNYGVGVPDEVKKLGTQAVLSRLRVDAEQQILEEPDVDQVRVGIFADSETPGLYRLRVAVRPKLGSPFAFEVPYSVS